MLVLTRRAGESVMIGSDVVVRVLEIRGDVVRVGVDAPRDVQVHREEVFNAVRAANLEAAAAGSPDPAVLAELRKGFSPPAAP
jgi:carbon storage regulator